MFVVPDLLRPFFLLIVPDGVIETASRTRTTAETPEVDAGPPEMTGSMAIRLNFRFRFVFGRTGETFSPCESDSFPAAVDAGAETRAEFQDSDRFFRDAVVVTVSEAPVFISSESVNCKLEVPRSPRLERPRPTLSSILRKRKKCFKVGYWKLSLTRRNQIMQPLSRIVARKNVFFRGIGRSFY